MVLTKMNNKRLRHMKQLIYFNELEKESYIFVFDNRQKHEIRQSTSPFQKNVHTVEYKEAI